MSRTPSSERESDTNLPLFAAGKSSGFFYRVFYKAKNGIVRSILYNSPHELILNLHAFENHNEIVYILKEDQSEYIKITVDQFKITIADTLYTTTIEQAEMLYLRLLLTNHHSRSISDRGRYRQINHQLNNLMLTIRGGIDSYISYQSNHKTALYMKSRRLSNIHLLAKVAEWHDDNPNGIYMTHINMPSAMRGQPLHSLFQEAVRLLLRKDRVRLYYYNPIQEDENDKIIPTEPIIHSAIIKAINQLIQ